MIFSKFAMDFKRSKSLESIKLCQQYLRQDRNGHCFCYGEHRYQSESSLEPCIIVDNRSEVSSLAEDNDPDDLDKKVSKVETKIDELNSKF